jgi:hypothetical protein
MGRALATPEAARVFRREEANMNEAKGAVRGAMIILLGAVALGAVACGDDEETTSGATTTAGAGGSGTTGAGGSSTTGSGGSSAGGAGGGATTGSGGSAATCLDAGAFDDDFALTDDALCVVAAYTADVVLGYDVDADYTREPSWGRHGGLVTMTPTASGASIERWTAPAGAGGALTKQAESVTLTFPAGSFVGAQAFDLPFFGWTALSYTGAFPDTKGEVFLVKGSALEASYPVNGLYAIAGLGSANEGRLVYSGLGALGDANGDTTGLYAADSCGSVGMDPRLSPDGDASCGASLAIAAWGDASGPIAADASGNLFAVDTSFDGTQELRGFAASTIARGAGPASGDVVMALPGFGVSIAALAPTDAAPGLLAFQPSDPNTYEALDVVEQRFTIDGATITPSDPTDAPKKLLHFTTANTPAHLVADGAGRLWMGVPASDTSTRFYVIARKP